ncbi:MAG: hypothetical protein GX038_01965 [Erysipelothrix sp.]|nr:hypothetical protein [Erysipelothrix sp.]
MKLRLKGKDGNILLYVLVFYIFFLSWFHIQIKKISDRHEDQLSIKTINRNLNIERQAVSYLDSIYPERPEAMELEGVRLEFECNANKCKIFVKGDINYSFLYVIIESNEIEWR